MQSIVVVIRWKIQHIYLHYHNFTFLFGTYACKNSFFQIMFKQYAIKFPTIGINYFIHLNWIRAFFFSFTFTFAPFQITFLTLLLLVFPFLALYRWIVSVMRFNLMLECLLLNVNLYNTTLVDPPPTIRLTNLDELIIINIFAYNIPMKLCVFVLFHLSLLVT